MFCFLLNDLLKASLSEMSAGKLQYHREGKVQSCSRSKELGKMQLVRKSEQGHWWQGSAPSVPAHSWAEAFQQRGILSGYSFPFRSQ